MEHRYVLVSFSEGAFANSGAPNHIACDGEFFSACVLMGNASGDTQETRITTTLLETQSSCDYRVHSCLSNKKTFVLPYDVFQPFSFWIPVPCVNPEEGGRGSGSPGRSQNIGFLSSTGPDTL